MNKPITEWPASLIVAIAVTIGCGYVLNTYFGAMMDDLGEISMPMIAVVASVLATVGLWFEVVKSYRFHKEQLVTKQARIDANTQGKMHWPEPKKDATVIEPEGKLTRVFKIDE